LLREAEQIGKKSGAEQLQLASREMREVVEVVVKQRRRRKSDRGRRCDIPKGKNGQTAGRSSARPTSNGANLSEANLDVANLSEANLRGAKLGGANLGGAKLGKADLGAAKLGGADLRRATSQRRT
jgi:Pentapeptide repeats (8 copies)